MPAHITRNRRTLLPITVMCMSLTITAAAQSPVQSPAPKPIPSLSPDLPNWQQEAGNKMEFEVASVREHLPQPGQRDPNKTNFPLGATPLYRDNGGLFSVKNESLMDLIDFAYYLTGMDGNRSFGPQLPSWAQSTRYDIEARAAAGTIPTKDQMRLMVQSLLADRFHLVVHAEPRQTSVYALRLIEPGKIGPSLKPHPADHPCGYNLDVKNVSGDDGLPNACGFVGGVPHDKNKVRFEFGGRAVPIYEIAKMMTVWIDDGRPVIDQTNLPGLYDFTIAFSPQNEDDTATAPPAGATMFGAYGPELVTAMKKQLGIKMDTAKVPVLTLVIDHIEKPTDN
jgi:uncharacterized protein (TIGR03435 family)